jgi:SnoaL-like domain
VLVRDSVEQAASIVAIQQLAIRYAVGVDQRDLDLVADQFVPDVICGHWGNGRDALKAMYHENDSTMDVTIHRVTNHMVDLVDDTHATGIVYLDADHRMHDGTWARLTGAYHDEYVLSESEGRWLIQSRRLLFWFRDSDALPPTTRRDNEYRTFSKWPTLPDAWPTWHAFWAEVGEARPEHSSVRRSREAAERSP